MGFGSDTYRVKAEESAKANAVPAYCRPVSSADWAARGWRGFQGIEHPEKSATRADTRDASILGMNYSLHLCNEKGAEKIMLRLDSWRYDQQGETTDLPILEMIFDERRFSSPATALESLKIMARPVRLADGVAARAVNTALFLIHQINAGQVADYERILELHRLHPGFIQAKDRRGRTKQ